MRYTVYFEMSDGHNVGNVYETEAEHPADVEAEITKGDDYVVSNPRKHVRVKRSDVIALIIELKES